MRWARPPRRRADHRHPLLEEVRRIERAGTTLRMVLHRHDGQAAVAQALHCAVVQVAVGDDDRGLMQRCVVHGIAVVLCRDVDAAARKILDRVIAAPVPERQLERVRPGSAPNDLVPEADPKDGHPLH